MARGDGLEDEIVPLAYCLVPHAWRYAPYGNIRLMAYVDPLSTTAEPFSRRLRSRALLVKICRRPAFFLISFPLPVRLNRLLAPL